MSPFHVLITLHCRGLGNMALSGPLPAHIFEAHPHLEFVNFEVNHFTGTLPVAWAASQVGSRHNLLKSFSK